MVDHSAINVNMNYSVCHNCYICITQCVIIVTYALLSMSLLLHMNYSVCHYCYIWITQCVIIVTYELLSVSLLLHIWNLKDNVFETFVVFEHIESGYIRRYGTCFQQ